jgi:hypothetical protein
MLFGKDAAGVTFAFADCSRFFQPRTTSASPRIISKAAFAASVYLGTWAFTQSLCSLPSRE